MMHMIRSDARAHYEGNKLVMVTVELGGEIVPLSASLLAADVRRGIEREVREAEAQDRALTTGIYRPPYKSDGDDCVEADTEGE